MCDVQWDPPELWAHVLSGRGVDGSTWELSSTFGASGSSVILVALTLSSFDR